MRGDIAEILAANKALKSSTRREAIREYAKGLIKKRKISKSVKARVNFANKLNRPLRGFEDVELLSGGRKRVAAKIAPFLAKNPQYIAASFVPLPGAYSSTAIATKLTQSQVKRLLKKRRKDVMRKIIYNRVKQ